MTRLLAIAAAAAALTATGCSSSSPPPPPTVDTAAVEAHGAEVELVDSRSSCSPDPLAGKIDVRVVLANRGDEDATVHVFVKRSYSDGNDDGNALDVAEVDVPAGTRVPVADTYDADPDAELVECRLWLEDGFVELPIRPAR